MHSEFQWSKSMKIALLLQPQMNIYWPQHVISNNNQGHNNNTNNNNNTKNNNINTNSTVAFRSLGKHLLTTNIYNRISYNKQSHNNDINKNNNKTATMTIVASGSVCLTFINHSLTQYEQLQK